MAIWQAEEIPMAKPKAAPARKPTPAPDPLPLDALDDEPTKGLTMRLNLVAWKQLKQVALDQGRTAHALLVEALNDYFVKCKKKPVA